MDFHGGNTILVLDPGPKLYFAALAGLCGAGLLLSSVSRRRRRSSSSTSPIIRARTPAESGHAGEAGAGSGGNYADADAGNSTNPGLFKAALLFIWACFIKPHVAAKDQKPSQQDALESFYSSQAGAYDATRRALLRGREDMLALVAAQLRFKAAEAHEGIVAGPKDKRIWVDVGGGTGFNIEAMSAFLDVPTFFSAVYLVDFSPSLCEVARRRFKRLGWTNVKVVCQDARKFRLEDYESGLATETLARSPTLGYFDHKPPAHRGADLITLSYSLSMIPDFFSVVDSLTSLLASNGIIGTVDFYAQSGVDVRFRNYTGGLIGRHVPFILRHFWRAWFDIDRVMLEPARRDYLEYRFGTVLSVNERNALLGYIPYYIWVGCQMKPISSSSLPHEIVERIDALVTESPYLLPKNQSNVLARAIDRTAPELRSKAFDAAAANFSANLPLPSFFYQNHHWRIYYDDQLPKHTQFNDEYIYAFTWEDTRADERILRLGADDVVLAITSAGDNILSYALQGPARIHAVDLNPSQNHLLELKVAAYAALPYADFWRIFGEGKHPDFRSLLINKLSPHLSSRAFQYWLGNSAIFTKGRGLYDTGGSRHAIRALRWLSYALGFRDGLRTMLEAPTLNEQREVWARTIRPALLSRWVSRLVVSQEDFLWRALGVPKNQLAMIEADHAQSESVRGPNPTSRATRSHAIWHYMVNTLDPVVEQSHVAGDNPYYLVCAAGQFSPRCHPDYLSPRAHARLSRPGALEGLRIHTDEIEEVIARISPGTLTVAVVMDSMDWFDPPDAAAGQTSSPQAASQIAKLNRALKKGGRVLLRSSALTPWYVAEFERLGFAAKRHDARFEGSCIDRVNMYASTWVCTKVGNLPPPTPRAEVDIVGVGEEPDAMELNAEE